MAHKLVEKLNPGVASWFRGQAGGQSGNRKVVCKVVEVTESDEERPHDEDPNLITPKHLGFATIDFVIGGVYDEKKGGIPVKAAAKDGPASRLLIFGTEPG